MNIFWDIGFESSERLLSLLDKNPYSPTFGSFHREHWHQRLCDFPSASRQQGLLCLALLYTTDHSENIFYKSDEIKDYLIGAFQYTLSLQNKDGSFDEWYPNERGWAGPTGYVTYALGRSYELCQDVLPEELKKKTVACLERGALFLADGWEEHVLFNHIAMALLPIYQVYTLTKNTYLLHQYKKLWTRFKKYWNHDEGWGIEYDSADIGYQSATVSFLARLYRYNKDENIKTVCEKSIDLLSYFAYPDHTFSRRIGCRQNETLFHVGLCFWSTENLAMASRLLDWDIDSLKNRGQLVPRDHDDHYFIYRLQEFLEAGALLEERGTGATDLGIDLPYEREDFQKHFSEAGIYCEKKLDSYKVINLKRGGHTLGFSVAKKSCEIVDTGILGKLTNNQLVTSLAWDPSYKISFGDESVEIRGMLHFWDQKSFTPQKMILFRLVMLIFGFHHKAAYWLKVVIRKILLKEQSRSHIEFKRVVALGEKNEIQSSLLSSEGVAAWSHAGVFDTRFVPQSRYFQKSDLGHKPHKKA